MLVLLLIALLSGGAGAQLFGAGSTFTVEGDLFMLNGEPFRYISGSIHYFRIHPNQWNDRLQKIRAAGLNAIQFYIPWNFHEHHMDQFNFQGDRNFSRFLELAQQNNLYAFVRIGPYVCGEWENGGIPWWLLKEKDIDLRSADTRFLWATKAWWHNMLPHLRPHLLRNGGNVLMVQIENEYGSFHACDYEYMETIRDYARKYLGKETILYTTDGASEEMLKCGTIPGAMPTVDFGIASHKSIDHYFELLDHYRPPPPKVNSEFYPGWLVLWGQTTNIVPDIAGILNSSQYMWDKNASFNFYMMHGGTNFGFWNGAETTAPVITSYDYTAPITEAGDITPKYLAIREWIGSLPNWTHTPLEVPQNSTKSAYGPFNVTRIGTPLQLKKFLTNKCVKSKYPMSFEELDSPYGFVLYETKLKVGGNSMLIEGIKDNGFMLLDGAFAGSFVSNFGNYSKHSVEIRMRPNQTVTILVENRGRQTYETINDFKGIIGNVTVNGQIVDDWEQCAIHMDDEVAQTIKNLRNPVIPTRCERFKGPEVYVGAFETPVPTDTFLLLPYWNKGSIFINGFNIGRYWQSAGPQPQLTLYVPKDILRPLNTIVIFELFNVEGCWGEVCSFKFVEAPIFNFIETPSQFGVRSGRTYKQNLIRRRTWNIKYPRWFGWD